MVPRAGTALAGRILISAIFLMSGIAKLTDLSGTVGHMNGAGIPHAEVLAIIAGIAEICGGLAILLGFMGRLGAIGLVVFMIPTTILFHGFWRFEGAEAKTQMVNFMKNLAIIGGLLMVAAYGPGKYSIDQKVRDPLAP